MLGIFRGFKEMIMITHFRTVGGLYHPGFDNLQTELGKLLWLLLRHSHGGCVITLGLAVVPVPRFGADAGLHPGGAPRSGAETPRASLGGGHHLPYDLDLGLDDLLADQLSHHLPRLDGERLLAQVKQDDYHLRQECLQLLWHD